MQGAGERKGMQKRGVPSTEIREEGSGLGGPVQRGTGSHLPGKQNVIVCIVYTCSYVCSHICVEVMGQHEMASLIAIHFIL